jgi:hypothetical protein
MMRLITRRIFFLPPVIAGQNRGNAGLGPEKALTLHAEDGAPPSPKGRGNGKALSLWERVG